jgi:hypothetical protein
MVSKYFTCKIFFNSDGDEDDGMIIVVEKMVMR